MLKGPEIYFPKDFDLPGSSASGFRTSLVPTLVWRPPIQPCGRRAGQLHSPLTATTSTVSKDGGDPAAARKCVRRNTGCNPFKDLLIEKSPSVALI